MIKLACFAALLAIGSSACADHFHAVKHHVPVVVQQATAVTYDTSIGLGVDANGFASLPLHSGASRYYVNSSTGSDTNTCTQAKSASTPKATILSAVICTTDGLGDQVLVAEGTSYPRGLALMRDKGGFSAQYPLVVESYDPADPINEAKLGRATGSNRPDIDIEGADSASGFLQGNGVTKYHAFRGLDFDSQNTVDAGVNTFTGAPGSPDYLLFENDVFNAAAITIQGSATTSTIFKAIIRNCAIYGQWGNSLSDHAQGLFGDHLDGLTVEDNVFWHNGWKVGDARTDDPTLGGPTAFNHPVYAQDTTRNTVVRRNVFIDTSADAGVLKGGGLYTQNLGLRNAIAVGLGGGNQYDLDAPLGVPIDGSYNAFLNSENIPSGGAYDWGIAIVNGMSGNSAIHHNILANSSAKAGYSFLLNATTPIHTNATAAMAKDSYGDFHDNVAYQWANSGATIAAPLAGQTDASNGALIHATFETNAWDDPASGSNTNISTHSFANAYSETTLLTALGYADETTAINDWIAHPEQHGWERGPSIAFAGYNITVPTLGDLISSVSITAGISTNGLFIGTHDGSALTFSGLPACVTPDSDARAWRADATCTPASGSFAVTETNGGSSHTTTLPYAIYARPVLSGLSVTPGTTTATINLSTNVGSGKLYSIISTSATVPDWPYLIIGLNADQSLPVKVPTPQGVTATGAQSISVIGLTTGTAYKAYVFQMDGNNNPSATSSMTFTTN